MNLVKGGQGRTSDAVVGDAWILFATGMLCLAFFGGCILGYSADAKGTLKNNVIGSGSDKK